MINNILYYIRQIFIGSILLFTSTYSFAQYDSIFHDNNYRTFLVHKPPASPLIDTFSLVIAMHGGLGTAYNMEEMSMLSEKADEANFIVVYPEGTKGGFLNRRTWNAGWCCGDASSSNADDVGFINALIDTIISQYTIDTGRIYATGMSNGGFMSFRLACELSHRIAAIAPVSASMSMIECEPIRAVPIINFHSYLDTNVPYLGGVGSGFSNHHNSPQDSVMNAWANMDTCSIFNDTILHNEQFTNIQWNTCSCETEIQYYITQDGGHSWPGGVQTITGDPPSEFLNANDLMWSFFQQYSLDCGTVSAMKENGDKNNNFLLYPNPTKGVVYIDYKERNNDIRISVYNHFGRIIIKSKNVDAINLINQPSGIYYIKIQTKHKILTKKIIKTY